MSARASSREWPAGYHFCERGELPYVRIVSRSALAGRPRRLLTVQWSLDAAGLGRPPRLPPMDPQYEQWVRQALVEPEQSKVHLIYALDQSYHHLHEARGAGTGQVERDCARV